MSKEITVKELEEKLDRLSQHVTVLTGMLQNTIQALVDNDILEVVDPTDNSVIHGTDDRPKEDDTPKIIIP